MIILQQDRNPEDDKAAHILENIEDTAYLPPSTDGMRRALRFVSSGELIFPGDTKVSSSGGNTVSEPQSQSGFAATPKKIEARATFLCFVMRR